MKKLRSHSLRKAFLALFFLLILHLAAAHVILPESTLQVDANPSTVISVDPDLESGNPEDIVDIDINIADVEDLWGWTFRVRRPLGPLSASSANEGEFLERDGGTTDFTVKSNPGYVAISCYLKTSDPGVSGEGTLVTIRFEVIDTGNCTIEPYDIDLKGISSGVPFDITDFTVEPGLFYTTYPVAKEISEAPYTEWFYTPNPTQAGHPVRGEPLTFNGSACYDPDDPYDSSPGGIVSYQWDFGDENVTEVSSPTCIHTYAENRTYLANLTVTDDDGETDTETFTVDVRLHDINIINVTATPAEVLPGGIININVTVLNEGSMNAYFNVTVHYNDTLVEMMTFKHIWRHPILHTPSVRAFLEPGENATMSWNPDPLSKEFEPLAWDTTGVAPGTYIMKAHAFLIDQSHIDEALGDVEEDLEDNTFTDCEAQILGHNIAITNIAVDPTSVVIGDTVYIDVTLTNDGDFTETSIEVTPYYDGTGAATAKTVSSLAAGASDIVEFEWDTTGVSKGTYTISANASVVPDETDTADNMLIGNQVILREPGEPVANFTYSPEKPSVNEEVAFNASSSEPDGGTIESYEWDFGDDTTAIYIEANLTDTANHTYTQSGTYTVMLNITDSEGKWATTSKPITVYASPVANFTYSPSAPVVGAPVTFNATASFDPDGGNATFPSGIVSYEWDFGDDGTDTHDIAEHTYTDAGEYSVILTVTDDEGMTNDTTATVTVSAALVHDVAVTDVTPSPTVAAPGQSVSVTVAVENEGDFAETFNVTAYYDASDIGTESVTLDSHANTTLIFTWNTAIVLDGTYLISAEADVVPGETDTSDNTFEDGEVAVSSGGQPPSVQALSIKFSGEREYYEDDDVMIRLEALVTYAGGPVANANVTIRIFDPEGAPWIPDVMVERLTGTGIYEWESSDTIAELELARGFYLIHVQARLGALQASEISQFHITSVQKTSSIISIDANPISVTAGSGITLSGAITPSRPRVTVTILQRPKGGNWSEVGTIKTSTNSHYSLGWVVIDPGTYEVKTSWLGDTRTEGAESEVKTVTVKPAGLLSIEIPFYIIVGIAAIIGSIVGSVIGLLVLMGTKKLKPA